MLIRLLHYNLTTKRLTAYCIDLWIVAFIGLSLALSLDYFDITFACWEKLIFNAMMILYLIKDLAFPQGSPGKKLMGLRLVVEADNLPALRKVLRNLTLFIWPVEAVVFLFIKKRLGDVMFYTKVVEV